MTDTPIKLDLELEQAPSEIWGSVTVDTADGPHHIFEFAPTADALEAKIRAVILREDGIQNVEFTRKFV